MNTTSLALILEPEELAALLPDENLLLVAVCSEQVFQNNHIPGSVLIQPGELVSGIKPATGKLPDQERLSALFSRIGLTENKHVIAYDDEGGGWAGRLIWTLDVLGHTSYSYLNGGLPSWAAAGLTLKSGDEPDNSPSAYQANIENIDRSVIADLEEVLQQIDDPESVIWDARSPEEYAGNRVTALKNGHIPGAINLDWLELMDQEHNLRLKPLADIEARLESLGISQAKTIIAHCQTHHRSGLAYLVGKALGLPIKAYDGSWSEWGNHPDTPVEC